MAMTSNVIGLAIILLGFAFAWRMLCDAIEELIADWRVRRAVRKGSALTLRRAVTVTSVEDALSASAGPSGHQPTSVQGESTRGR